MGHECKETPLQQELLLLALRKTELYGRPQEQGPRNQSPQVPRLLSHRGLGSSLELQGIKRIVKHHS